MRWIAAALAMMLMGAPAEAQRKPGDYPHTPDSLVQPGTPQGRLEGPFEFRSAIFPGTVRRYWVHVPAGYDPERPPNLLVFQDGQRATAPQGSLRVPVVLDNLIARGEIPQTLGLFVTPGNLSEHYPGDLGMQNPDHRRPEYDALDDDYARMLLDELMPLVARRWRFADDPKRRVIGGTSSGAIAAWTVAWHRPDAFANVISIVGSYTSIAYEPAGAGKPMVPGGDLYPTLIRKTPIKPIRIFLQDGSADLDNEHGSWFLANQQMLAALNWANADADAKGTPGPRYDVAHVWGDGGHSDQHGGAILPDMLRWIWRDQRPAADPRTEFMARIRALCGQAFAGRVTTDDPADRGMASRPLVMHVAECGPDEIRIPFHVGEDRSRTWVISRTAGGLRLKHDHRHADGSADPVTLYGGETAGPGAAGRQDFPVDAESIALFRARQLDRSSTNVWAMEVDERRLAYELRRPPGPDARHFRVEFDLTRPVAAPPPPWGGHRQGK